MAEYLDFPSKAKELGITEAVLRARVLSESEMLCFVYLANARAYGSQTEPFPAWSEDEFPEVRWTDSGSAWEDEWGNAVKRVPRYIISGWAAIRSHCLEEIMTRGEITLSNTDVWVTNADLGRGFPARLHKQAKRHWVDVREHEEGGYYREVEVLLRREDLFIRAEQIATSKGLSPRKERSYLGIIAALRGLLLDKDGGDFPNQARIIEALESRYGTVDGVSKRNLEGIFAEATREVGNHKAGV